MLSQPLTSTVAAPPGNGDESGNGFLAAAKREDFAQGINLDLEIGRCACDDGEGLKEGKKLDELEKNGSFFTAAQICDFYNQELVYNSIVSGLPVPLHLVLPIWLSVFNSLGPAVYKFYPSFVGFSPRKTEYRSNMNSESERCRRTDGRKWRCSKNVVQNQKYCEGHMHRGRQGSRKHVEPHGKNISQNIVKTPVQNSLPVVSSLSTSDRDSRIAVPAKMHIGQRQPYLNGGHAGSRLSGSKNANPGMPGGGKKHEMEIVNCPGDLAPKSVFQHGNFNPGQTSITESASPRCQTMDSLPNQNNCEMHGLVGAKREISGPQQPSSNKRQATSLACTTGKSLDKIINLNSLPSKPQVVGGNNSTGSSSDATTITDENVDICVSDHHTDN